MATFQGYQRNIERNVDNTPVLDTANNEQIHATYNNVSLKFNNEDHGNGTIYITTSRLVWMASDTSKVSYAFPYLGMVLHAVSKDKALCETPCVFIQLQGDSADDEEGEIPVVILAPAQAEQVENIFEGISHMNSLIEPLISQSEDESDGEDAFDEEDDEDDGAIEVDEQTQEDRVE
ncbi:Nucleotide-sensitive chloride conductance regulator ICln, putative [Babesia ovata]|uniref:Nucleotide-sensitive chloride conductance regulator ICln, putative n=1 Tax=Babesia ovata TaxID=189622 RepID=A0A2H6K7L5_9APIC|nr:Nucleotide-sensitive chloride conductance regulator ICln, putative [Babesia ovata]GBE58968.1 Nucleotide-sensitive chloride conductance regulator ICln, putative [Babesia ovata]